MKKRFLNALNEANDELSVKSPVSIDAEVMSHISGGKSSGWICTISGECREDGTSCWQMLREAIQAIDVDSLKSYDNPHD